MNKMLRLILFFSCFAFIFTSCQEKIEPLSMRDSKIPTYNKIHKKQQIKDRLEQEKLMTMDLSTGMVPRKDLFVAQKDMWKQQEELALKTAIPNVEWDERGPNNIGGRTRAIMFDPNDATSKKVWAGGVGGGVWYNDDITSATSSWQNVDDFWSNMAVTSIAHDPVNTLHFYAGTGEGFGNFDAIDGDGVWKSTDGGTTWNQLSTTTNFNDVNKIVCFAANSIAVATNNGLRISTNGGASWLTPRSGSHADVEVAANGDLYASNFAGDVFKSVDNGSNWSTIRNGSGNRVELATAPSDASVVYALVNTGSNVTDILKTVNGGTTWLSQTIPLYLEQGSCQGGSNPFTRGQGWYDLISIVHPTDSDKIIIGGIDLFRSDDGGTSWESISYWTGQCDDYVHADQHALALRPGFPNAILSGSDGGISYSDDAFDFGANPDFNTRNNNYNVTQYYAVAVHPDNTITNILGGTQDNGTHRFTQSGINSVSTVTGGDGAFCHIDQDQPNIQITSYVYNNYYVTTNGTNFTSYSLGNTGRFINPTDYDSDANILYACKGSNEYLRVQGFGGSLSNNTINAPLFGGQVSAVRVSPNVDNRVYFGINANGGKIIRVDNAHTSNPTFTELAGTVNGYVSSIDVEVGNEDHLLITFSNFNVTSVWESTNGGTSFTGVEGDIPNMPVRWGIFDPNSASQAIVATEMGVWTTTLLNGGSTDWDPTNSGLANTRVDMIEYRASDNFMVAGTHGRGVFTSTSFNLGCNISVTSIGDQVCDAATSTYSQELTLELSNTPATGQLDVNGSLFDIPLGQESATVTITLTDLTADGNPVDASMFFTADNSCQKDFSGLFNAPNPGCVLDNDNCQDAFPITESGTYTSNGPSSGNGCNNCSSSTHADWYKFTAPSDGLLTIQTCGYGVDTRFFFYAGDCGSLVLVANNDDACILGGGNNNTWASQVEDISITGGVTYYLEWDNRWSSSAVTFDFLFTSTADPCENLTHRFVDESLAVSGDGCTWATAYNNLQDAINGIENEGTVTDLWVKAGTYNPGFTGETVTRNTSFNIAATTTIYGGFAGNEVALGERDIAANPVILSGDIGVAFITSDNSYQVVTHAAGNGILTLDGLTISDGNNDGNTSAGSGVYNTGEIRLFDCTIQNNLATSPGSGVCNNGASAIMTMENCMLTGNSGVQYCVENGAELVVPSGKIVTIE